jgi:S-methylmethionine-dependent homocysteine/selenocysteine methylase
VQHLHYDSLKTKLERGDIIILDGGTGTEVQARGVPMSGESWCADANATHGDVIAGVHSSYIAAGADAIIANTFATSALSFNAFGRDDDLLQLDRLAVQHAKAAAKDVPVAGSISTMRPVIAGTDRTSMQQEWNAADAKELFRRKAQNLKDCGVDFIAMEMMRDCDYSVLATEAAMETGLPVWIGLSFEKRGDGQLAGFGREDQLMEDVIARHAALKPAAISIMHTSINDMQPALECLKKKWDGPLGAYPESGYFKMPDWQFVDIVSPDDLVAAARHWQGLGVMIFGGCCGLGPQHIKALAGEFKS